MALDFPGPGGLTVGQIFTSGGQSWEWDGTKWAGGTAGGGSSGTVTSVAAGAGITASPSPIVGAGSIALTVPVAVASGGTGGTTGPAGLANLGGISGNQTITLSGDIAGSGTTAITATLATVNANVGTFQGLTIDGKGRITAAANQGYLATTTAASTYVAKAGDTMTGNLTVNRNAVAPGAPDYLHARAADGQSGGVTVDTFGTGAIPNIEQRTARGTAATPTATQATDYLARWQGYGYQGGYQLGANLTFNATENWTGAARGAYISFATTTLGTTTFREAAILANGLVVGSGIGSDPGNGGIYAAGAVTAAGLMKADGHSTHAGNGGAYDGHNFNIAWNGTAQLWVDAVNAGTIQFVASDERIKSAIRLATTDALAALNGLEIIEYDLQQWEDIPPVHYSCGFSAQQLRNVIPEAVVTPDDPADMLGVQLLPLVAHLVRAVQQLTVAVTQLQAKVT